MKPGAYCCVCESWYPQEKIVYGRDPQFPMDPPDHWCKMHAKMYHVQDYVAVLPKTSSSSSHCKTNRIPH